MQKYIDAHCHILSDAQMHQAAAHGVGRFVINATRPSEWAAVAELAQCDNIYGAIGVHPWYVSEISDGWDNKLIDLLAMHPRLMVGEIGLDKNRPDIDAQESAFRRQIQIAHDMRRVAHIHMVGTWGRCMEILRGCSLPPAIVFHAFSGAPELINELTTMNAYFSFGSAINDVKRTRLRLSVAAVPMSRILVESDAPDIVTPDTIPDTVAEIARIRGENFEQMAKTIYTNTMGLLDDKSV